MRGIIAWQALLSWSAAAVVCWTYSAPSVAQQQTQAAAPSAAPQACKPSEYAADTYFPKPAFAGQTRAPASSSHVSYRVDTVAKGLAHPWSLAFLPDRRMPVTEKAGRLRIVSLSGGLSPPLEGVPTLAKFPDGDGGVHDVLLDPQFAANRILYGPRGGDELNVIRPGKNYGYPIISYGREYSGELIHGGLTAKAGLEQPVYFWTPDIAPSGLLIYRGGMFPEWKGNLFIGALATKRLVRLRMKNGRVAAEESLLAERCQRIRDVREGPEGAIYLLTDEDDGQMLRLVRGS